MSITLDLSDELASELSAEATQLGLPLAEYVLRVLTMGRANGNMPQSGAELVAYWQSEGLVGVRSDIVDSQQYARRLRTAAEHRASLAW